MFVVLLLTLAAPPTFVVENKMPPVFAVTNRIPAPEVAVPVRTTFRGPEFDPDHQCNRCGRSQYVISGWLPNGQHTHTCRACNYTWRH